MKTNSFSLPPEHPRWSWWDVIIVLAVLLGLLPAAEIFKTVVRETVTVLGATGISPQSWLLFLSTAFQASVLALAVVLLTRRRGASSQDLGLHWKNGGLNILTGLFGGLLLWGCVLAIGLLVTAVTGPPPPQEIEKLLVGLADWKDLVLPLLSVSVLAPVSEELYVRGMAYPVIRARFGPAGGMVLSALFFGALHLDLYRLIPITAGGIGLAYLYEKTGSLLTSIIAHSIWNTLMLLILFLGSRMM